MVLSKKADWAHIEEYDNLKIEMLFIQKLINFHRDSPASFESAYCGTLMIFLLLTNIKNINVKSKNTFLELFITNYLISPRILKYLIYFIQSDWQLVVSDVFLKSFKTEQTPKLKTNQSFSKHLKCWKIIQILELEARFFLFSR